MWGGVQYKPSIFDNIAPDDLIIAFFPCTRFSARVPLMARAEMYQAKNWDITKKINYSQKIVEEINYNYQLLCNLVKIAVDRGLKLIIENPYTQPHFLTQYFPLKPALIDMDRTLRGDHYKKPTQYYFINIEPKNNFIWEPQIHIDEIKTISKVTNKDGLKREVIRSQISNDYASRFIKEFIL